MRKIVESVFTPCLKIFNHPRSNLPSSFKHLSETSLASYMSYNRRSTLKPRPCIMLQDGILEYDASKKGDCTEAELCITATFEGDPLSKLPLVFSYFCVPISPHSLVPLTHKDTHVHSMPLEWPRVDGWIIAWRMQSEQPIGPRWVEGDEQTGGPGPRWYFGSRAMATLDKECEERREYWFNMCDDPNESFQLAENFFVRIQPISFRLHS